MPRRVEDFPTNRLDRSPLCGFGGKDEANAGPSASPRRSQGPDIAFSKTKPRSGHRVFQDEAKVPSDHDEIKAEPKPALPSRQDEAKRTTSLFQDEANSLSDQDEANGGFVAKRLEALPS
jgi:hypothetical protein